MFIAQRKVMFFSFLFIFNYSIISQIKNYIFPVMHCHFVFFFFQNQLICCKVLWCVGGKYMILNDRWDLGGLFTMVLSIKWIFYNEHKDTLISSHSAFEIRLNLRGTISYGIFFVCYFRQINSLQPATIFLSLFLISENYKMELLKIMD